MVSDVSTVLASAQNRSTLATPGLSPRFVAGTQLELEDSPQLRQKITEVTRRELNSTPTTAYGQVRSRMLWL